MTLQEFLTQTQNDVQREMTDRTGQPGPFPYPVSVFSEIVMDHMAEANMTSDPQVNVQAGAESDDRHTALSSPSAPPVRISQDMCGSDSSGAVWITPVPPHPLANSAATITTDSLSIRAILLTSA